MQDLFEAYLALAIKQPLSDSTQDPDRVKAFTAFVNNLLQTANGNTHANITELWAEIRKLEARCNNLQAQINDLKGGNGGRVITG